MLSMFNNKYPYTDFHELNLDWILAQMKELTEEMQNFIELNSNIIKYADPIQWDITSQYQQYTIVMDNNVAYLSKQPVPTGIAISDTDYWLPIFDMTPIITNISNIRDQISAHYETSYTATQNYNVGDWMFILDSDNDLLYYALTNISINGGLVPGVNIQKVTVEDLVKMCVSDIATINTNMGDLATLTTADQTSLVNAINEVDGDVGDLSTLTTTDKTSAVNAINELDTDLGTVENDVTQLKSDVGDLSTLTTTDKTSLVNAINEINAGILPWTPNIIINAARLDPSWGLTDLVGDGVTDNSTALNDLMTYISAQTWPRCAVFFPAGTYIVNSQISVPSYVLLIGEGTMQTSFRTNNVVDDLFVLAGYNEIYNMNIQCMQAGSGNAALQVNGMQCIFKQLRIYNFQIGLKLTDASGTKTELVYIQTNVTNAKGISINGRSVSSKFTKTTVYATDGVATVTGFSYDSGDYCMDMQFIQCETGLLYRGIVLNANTTTYPGDLLIDNCIFDGMYDSVVRFANANASGSLIISNNWINYRPLSSNVTVFTLASAHGVIIHDNRIATLNTGGQQYLRGVGATSCGNIKIHGNDFHNVSYAANIATCNDVEFVGNTITNDTGANGTAVLNLGTVVRAIVSNNICDGDYNYPAIISALTDSIIKNNVFNTTNQITYTDASCLIGDNLYD